MDFKFDDLIDDEENENNNSKKKKKKSKNLPIILVIILSIIIGFTVFFTSNLIFNKQTKPIETVKKTPIDINDETVQILYSYVTYGVSGTRSDKFIKENSVDISSFSNMEKFYYALQFVEIDDFTTENKFNSQKQKLYYISNSIIRKYMERFFGPNITYQTDSLISYPFNFSVNGQNVGIMTYSSNNDSFETVFYGVESNKNDNQKVKSYYTKLVEANKNEDLSYELKEKIIYTKLEKNAQSNTYKISIYRDYNKTDLIDIKDNLTEEQINNNPIKIDNYINQASTITYNFKINNGVLYFDSSTITKSNKSAE